MREFARTGPFRGVLWQWAIIDQLTQPGLGFEGQDQLMLASALEARGRVDVDEPDCLALVLERRSRLWRDRGEPLPLSHIDHFQSWFLESQQ